MSYLGVMLDMAGCPNRCRHCWLGSHKNGNMSIDEFRDIAGQFKSWKDENGNSIRELGFFSWWREPDYRDDYRELWKIEQELSSPGQAQRFELLSIWRLARDESYAPWALRAGDKSAPPLKAVQITFGGMEENTEWFIRRKGAWGEWLLATERLISAGISPRWQVVITKRCLHETGELVRLMKELRLWERCEKFGGKFEFFIGNGDPEGNCLEIEDLRVEEKDLPLISPELIGLSRDGLNMGKPEYQLVEEMLLNNDAPNIKPPIPCVMINADYDVYPNIAEPTEWWRLGNLKTDGVDAIIKAYRDETPPGMKANREIQVSELAKRYGDPKSSRMYDGSDIYCRWLHQWGMDYMEGQNEK
jgi:hypothetical protein